MAENNCDRWKDRIGGIKADETKRLRELDKQNARLKALIADLDLDKLALQEALRENS